MSYNCRATSFSAFFVGVKYGWTVAILLWGVGTINQSRSRAGHDKNYMTSYTGSTHMLQGVAGGAADYLQLTMNSNTGSICMLRGVVRGAANFLQPTMNSNTGSICMLQYVAGGAANFFATITWLVILAQPTCCKVWPDAVWPEALPIFFATNYE